MTGTRIRAWALAGVALAVLAAGLLFASGLGSQGALESSPLVGREAPDFTLPGLDGRPESTVRLSDLRGQVVVVNFWASWCTECHTEQAALNQTWQRFRDAGVVMVGVNFQDATGDARQYVAESGTSYPTVVDATSSTALAYGLRGVPETYVIDRTGMMVDHILGPVTSDRLADPITRLLGDGTQ
ncbi:MAG TPA: TlpA disulfide reductase family protein [Jiangellaceae bacterium]|nr:TlpA disulfide reductase family protein [Jiangellaceae bacterium]